MSGQSPLDLLEEAKRKEEELVVFLEAYWIEKQFDQLQMMLESVKHSLKGSPFNPKFLRSRDNIMHDLHVLQPVLFKTGLAAAGIVERKYGVVLLTMVAPEPEEKTLTIIKPTEEKT